jgi:urea transport system substrate-binding protein
MALPAKHGGKEDMTIKRRTFLKGTAAVAAGAAATLPTKAPYFFVRNIAKAEESDTIKVGILHSLSGTIAIIERSLKNAELLAIEEINANGGINGKMIEPVVEDPQSMVQVFNEKAKKLLLEDKVVAVMGCYTSASRQSVLPVFEQYNGVLLYPTLYEAQECSKNCFYTGAVPNQQLDDFVPWIINTLGRKKFYLIGANYIYPKETNREVKALLKEHGGETVAEEYAPLGHTEFSTNITKIASSGCDVVFSDLVGDQIVAFYKQFRQFGITAEDLPICTPITTEQEIQAMGAENAVGHYTSFNYFQSVDTPENKSFVDRFKAKYGDDQVTNAVMEAAYFQTFFLAQAIEKVGTDADALIFEGLPGQEYQAPQGKVKIDEKNHHTWLWARIGQANEAGQFDVVWKSENWIRPDPWVDYLYPHKDCDFTNQSVLDRLKKPWSEEKNRSGTMDI